MNRIVIILVVTVLCTCMLAAQPLSGSYTIGGTTPDFVTLQDAGNALKLRGVAGPTFFNIRPGTYSRNGGNNTVLRLDSIVAGLSAGNRITFQPDANEGGNVGNTILQMTITDIATADPQLILIKLDFISFNNITFQESDASINTGTLTLVQLQRNSFLGLPPVSGTVFEGCRFIGTDPTAGTENGIDLGSRVIDITIRGNTFLRLLRGISGSNSSSSAGSMIIEDNQFLEGWHAFSGSGNALGSAMEIFSENLIIRRNIIDFNGSFNSGYRGISILVMTSSETIIVEQNSIEGTVSASIVVIGQGGIPDSFIVANNMINAVAFPLWANEGAVGIRIDQNPPNAQVLFNTIVLRGGGLIGLHVDAVNSSVLNNIIIAKPSSGSNYCYVQGSNTNINFQSDYNVLLTTTIPPILVIRNSVFYSTLGAYQSATGLDINSISKDIDFVDSADVHISDCQAQDPDLKGIPVAGITVDIDDEIRSTTAPMIGADENSFSGFGMFADPFKAGLPGSAFSVASGRFDNILFDGLAVPDYNNRQVLLYHNLPPRSFVQSGTLSTGFKPNVVKFFDLDRDNNLDLIVGGDTTALKVFWGDGFGNFPSDTTIITVSPLNLFSGGRVRSLDTGRVSFVLNSSTILITEDNGFVTNSGFLAYLDNSNGRHLSHRVTQGAGAGPDTLPHVPLDFIVGNFDGNSDPEVAVLTLGTIPPPMYVFNDTNAQGGGGFLPYGTRYSYQLGAGSSPGHASSVISGDFDGDLDLDLVALSTFSSCVFIRNLGNFSFVSTPISVAGAQALVRLDYENDGDLDFATLNERLEENGITVFLNGGTGQFTQKENCFFPFASGRPFGATASDFDQDGKTDIAVVAAVATGADSLFVLYNLGGGVTHTPGGGTREIPFEFTLEQNYPNPFNPSTSISYTLPIASHVVLKIYSLLGQEVATLVNEERTAGSHIMQWNGQNRSGQAASSGVYFYRMEVRPVGGQLPFASVKKMILIK
jgi:flagellar hook assembly protein FlgD